MGLPAVSLALLTALLDLPTAMALMLVPSFVTNVWQAVVGGNGVAILKRLPIFFLLAFGAVWVGGQALVHVDLALLSALLGILLVLYGASGLANYRMTVGSGQEGWAGPAIGFINGIFTGMTGSFAFPGVLYLQALGLKRDELIQAMGILFTLSTVGVAISLQSNALLTMELGVLSGAGLIPAILGMTFGQRIRQRMSEELFRRVFLIALVLLGAYIGVTATIRYLT
ncbi:MAG: TSUP family transporter [Alphaproteobacteria bacterium]|nr:TSUP family transporter [Alphaproteobacteria bacterium]